MQNQDQEVEQALLGGLLVNNDVIFELNLTPNDFYYPPHKKIFERMLKDLHETGEFSYATMGQWAKGQEFITGESGNRYIMALRDNCITSTPNQLQIYANVLKEYSNKRQLQEKLEQALEKVKAPDSKSHEVISIVNNVLDETTNVENLIDGETVFKKVLQGIEKPNKCFSTGLGGLDKAMAGGFYAGWTYGFCGAEKSGKTMLATTLAYNMTHQGCKLLYIALEMGSTQIEQRSIARQLGFNPIKFLDDPNGIARQVAEAKPNPNINYLDMQGATLDDILLNVAKAKVKMGINGFILDYWQLVRATDNRTTEEKHLRDVAQFISDFARKNDLFCIILAQMNQDGRLFGGNGLRKACDQLYMIEQYEEDSKERWLRMDASRYTLRGDLGSETQPYMIIDRCAYFREI